VTDSNKCVIYWGAGFSFIQTKTSHPPHGLRMEEKPAMRSSTHIMAIICVTPSTERTWITTFPSGSGAEGGLQAAQ